MNRKIQLRVLRTEIVEALVPHGVPTGWGPIYRFSRFDNYLPRHHRTLVSTAHALCTGCFYRRRANPRERRELAAQLALKVARSALIAEGLMPKTGYLESGGQR